MEHPELAGLPVVVPVDVEWTDMDAFAHVNNAVYFRYFERARVTLLERIGWFDSLRGGGPGPIVHSTNCRYRKALTYPDRLLVGARVADVQADRITVEHRIVSTKLDALAAEGTAVMVSFDYKAQAKAALPDEVGRRIAELHGGGK